jgi:hypothetical protein
MEALSYRESAETQEWLPPEPYGHNALSGEGISGDWYVFDHHRTQRVEELPDDATPFKTYSIYHNEGRIWIVPYDATQNEVGNGGASHGYIGWRLLSFLHCIPTGTTASLATYAGNQPRLAYQRPDQRWVGRLLPPNFHAWEQQHTTYDGYGGMNGHLPIIIALIMFSARRSHAERDITHCLQGDSWRSWSSQGGCELPFPSFLRWAHGVLTLG